MTQQTETLEQSEIDALLGQPNVNTLVGCRNLALLQLIAQTGIRCGEALQVEDKDIKTEQWEIAGQQSSINVLRLRKQTTKGKRERVGLPLTDETMSALNSWRQRRDILGLEGGPLFCTVSQGERAHAEMHKSGGFIKGTKTNPVEFRPGRVLNSRYVRAMIKRYAKAAGIEKRVYPHLLRHSALTRIYDGTQDIRLVQEVAGHQDIKTTQRYTHVHPMNIARAMGVV